MLTAVLTGLVTHALWAPELTQALAPAPCWAACCPSGELEGLLHLPCCHHLHLHRHASDASCAGLHPCGVRPSLRHAICQALRTWLADCQGVHDMLWPLQ